MAFVGAIVAVTVGVGTPQADRIKMDNINTRKMGFMLMTSSHTRFHQIHQPIESSFIYRLRLDSAFTAYNLESSYHTSHAQQAILISAKVSRFHMSTQNPVHPVIE